MPPKDQPIRERAANARARAVTPQQLDARGGRKPINLALQGGGAHGAFTWGVLDRLVEDDRLAIEAVSATSAGALNAVAMAHGLSLDGAEGAKRTLEAFWREVSRRGRLVHPLAANPWLRNPAFAPWAELPAPGLLALLMMSQVLSPYDINPMNYNPLREALAAVVDFEHLQACQRTCRLFVSATNVRSGKIKVFEHQEVTLEAVVASACLPNVFQAVEIDGEHYWDGGYMGNPAIFPLIYHGASRDVVVVHINPMRREALPRTASEIRERENEITFNASLMREMRAIAFVSKLIDEDRLDHERYRRMLVHSIMDDAEMAGHSFESKYNLDWGFLCGLRDAGRRAAYAWLEASFDHIGERTTAPIAEMYL